MDDNKRSEGVAQAIQKVLEGRGLLDVAIDIIRDIDVNYIGEAADNEFVKEGTWTSHRKLKRRNMDKLLSWEKLRPLADKYSSYPTVEKWNFTGEELMLFAEAIQKALIAKLESEK